jgi:hypothetical protein
MRPENIEHGAITGKRMKMKILVLGMAVLISTAAAQQSSHAKGAEGRSILEPPASLPDDCSISEVLLISNHGQSETYKLLAYEIAALDMGHQGQAGALSSLKLMKSNFGADPTAMLAEVFRNFDISTNKFRCGAFFAGEYHPTTKDHETARNTFRKTLISVYNRLAIVNERMRRYVDHRFRDSINPDTNTVLNNADILAKLTEERNEAFSDLVSATELSAMLSIYTGDKSAAVADTLNISSAERKQLLIQLGEIVKSGSPDEFTKNAELLDDFLIHHPKVRD